MEKNDKLNQMIQIKTTIWSCGLLRQWNTHTRWCTHAYEHTTKLRGSEWKEYKMQNQWQYKGDYTNNISNWLKKGISWKHWLQICISNELNSIIHIRSKGFFYCLAVVLFSYERAYIHTSPSTNAIIANHTTT